MTPEQQQIAIAEANCYSRQEADSEWFDSPVDGQIHVDDLPDYLKDLNAMYAAWKGLTAQQKLVYRAELAHIAARESPNRESCWLEDIAAEFGPEAYLRTIGKWEGKKP